MTLHFFDFYKHPSSYELHTQCFCTVRSVLVLTKAQPNQCSLRPVIFFAASCGKELQRRKQDYRVIMKRQSPLIYSVGLASARKLLETTGDIIIASLVPSNSSMQVLSLHNSFLLPVDLLWILSGFSFPLQQSNWVSILLSRALIQPQCLHDRWFHGLYLAGLLW